MTTKKGVGQRLRQAREDAGLTQQDASNRVGYSVRQIGRFENKGTGDLFVIQAFAEAYGIHVIKIIIPPSEWHTAAIAIIPRQILDYFLHK
ncbi:MAG: helix-turn-helix transcriptional regulator [Candidatus Sedimenticola sp. (ex Thyasira tokunagai)]